MVNLRQNCDRFILSEKYGISDFDCGNEDLNEFFNCDALQYRHQMLSETCFFRYKSNGKVDAYNDPAVLSFYQKNDFMTVFSTEEQEKETYRQSPSEPLQTRYMFFDMMQWRNKMM